jgi:beta-alanine--pyruvate transaminase
VRKHVYEAFMDNAPDGAIELFHGYTYSGHPLACAAGLATLDVYKEEGLFERAASLAPYWEDAAHSLKGAPHVVDIRNIGLVAGVELEPRPGAPGARGYEVFTKCYAENVLVRVTGDIIAASPPYIIEKREIDQLFETLGRILREVD